MPQRNPKQEYKREAFKLFEQLLENVKYEVVRFLSRVQVRSEEEVEALERQQREAQEREQQRARYMHASASGLAVAPDEDAADAEPPPAVAAEPFVRETPKVGRNEPCPCGSGKKYKHCHGQIA
jgi:preprotein translocase subunit SecA